jgi:hypothetical protein
MANHREINLNAYPAAQCCRQTRISRLINIDLIRNAAAQMRR